MEAYTVVIDASVILARHRSSEQLQAWLMDDLAHVDAAVSYGNGRLSVTMTVQTEFGSPLEDAHEVLENALALTGAHITHIHAVEVLTAEEHTRRLAQPAIPPLVGSAEAAALIGVSRQRVSQLRQWQEFPLPAIEVGGAPMWTLDSIEAFQRTWDRSPGRPVSQMPHQATASQ